MAPLASRAAQAALQFDTLVGVGGIGSGVFLALEGNHLLGRNESRPARSLPARDYCKLHIVSHYLSVLLGSRPSRQPFHLVAVGVVGSDQLGMRLLAEMEAVGIDARLVDVVDSRPTLTSVCFTYPDGSGGNISPIDSAAALLTPEAIDRAESYLLAAGRRGIALALPEVPLDARHHLLNLGTRTGAFRVASFTSSEITSDLAAQMLSLVDLVLMNEDEVAAFTGQPADGAETALTLQACSDGLSQIQPKATIVVSAGQSGAFAFREGVWDHAPAPAVMVSNTAGAGDALLAGVLAAYIVGAPFSVRRVPPTGGVAKDLPIESAVDFGVILASYSVMSPHSIHPDVSFGSVAAFVDSIGRRYQGVLAEEFGVTPGRGPAGDLHEASQADLPTADRACPRATSPGIKEPTANEGGPGA